MQKVLITAGAGGIGRAMAEAFAASGAAVWVVDSDADALAACPDAWRRDIIDVTDETAITALFDRLEREWGGLDALCANAGIAGPTALIEDQPLEGFRSCVAVNLEGAFLFTRAAAPLMKRAGRGRSSIPRPPPGFTAIPTARPMQRRNGRSTGL